MNNKFDFIGDIHGYVDKLKMLLYKMGYNDDEGYFQHPTRKAFFIGDYIDRGPDNPGVISLVKAMVDNNTAIALMGNHEYNAVLFNILGENGYLRPHKIKNIKQHYSTLVQYQGNEKQYKEDVAWFKTLPLYYEGGSFNACHAAWNTRAVNYLNQHSEKGILTDQLFNDSAVQETQLYEAVEIICKGLETKLPNGKSFRDKENTKRYDIRLKWWENPQDKTFKEMSVVNIDMESIPFKESFDYYKESEVPVFFGHYWLSGKPVLLKPNVCCLDYSVAKDGYIVAYRFNGEKKLSNENLVYL